MDTVHSFTDAYTSSSGGKTYFCHRTGMLCLEEVLAGGEYSLSGIGISGYPPETSTVPDVPRADPSVFVLKNAFRVELSGIPQTDGWEVEGFGKTREGEVLSTSITLVRKGLRAVLHTSVDGTSTVTRSLTLENLSSAPAVITKLALFGGGLAHGSVGLKTGEQFTLGYMHDSHGGCEGDYHTLTLPRGEYSFGRTVYPERFRAPFFTLENRATGITFLGQLGFSGAYTMRFRNDCRYGSTALSFSCEVGAESPVLVLAPGEVFDTPAFHFCAVAGGLDDAVNEMNDHFRLFSSPYKKEGLLEAGIGPEVDMSQESILHSIDTAASIGAEVFYIDASWYAGEHGERNWPEKCGNWDPHPFRYEMPMTAIRDCARAKGLKFGLWMDAEKVGFGSEIWDTEMPPKLRDKNGNYVLDGACRTVDASVKEGADWLFDSICSLIDRYGLDFFRLDSGAYSFTSFGERCGIPENRDLRYYANWYGIFKRLRAKYPDVIFQNCAGGGARLDFGMVAPMSNTWITDQQIAPWSYRVLNGCSMQLPVEYFVRGVGGQNVQIAASLDFQLNVARFGNPVCSYNTPASLPMNSYQLDKIGAMLKTYKEIVRPHLDGCRVYHHTPEINETAKNAVGILEIASRDKGFGMLGVFALTKPEEASRKVCFRGLSAGKRYRVWIGDRPYGELDGYTLTECGITVRIETALDSRVIVALAV